MDKKNIRWLTYLLALLLISFSFLGERHKVQASSGQISIDVRQTDLRDVLSALAIKTNTNIVLLEEPTVVTFSVDNVTPMKALELLLQSEGLTYIKEGKLLIVGRAEKLQNNNFADQTLTRFDLVYIRTQQFQPLLTTLGLPVKSIILEANPYVVWIQGIPQDLVKVKELLAAVDQPENRIFVEDEEIEIDLDYRELTTYAVEPSRLAELVKKSGIPLDKYITLGNRLLIFDQQVLDQWDQFYSLVIELDKIDARGSSVFPFTLQNIVARDAATRLAAFGYQGVRIINFNFPEFSQEIIVLCPPELESQVFTSLVSIDVSPESIKAPIMSAKGEFAQRELQAKRRLLAEMTSIPLNNMYISENLSGDANSPYYVLWAHEAPDNIKLLQDLVDSF